MLTRNLIYEAAKFLHGKLRRTPVEPSPGLAELLGVPVWLKLESLQITGSFKIRGALFRMSRLSEEEKRAGIATCSAGNHGKGVAYAARELGVKAAIYVPSSVDESKHRGMVALGADVHVSQFAGYDDTEAWALDEAARAGRPFISAFDDDDIMAANGGTLAQEVVEDVPQAQSFIFPVGGGGLAAGFSFYAAGKEAVFIACQHELSPGLKMSLEKGEAVTRLPSIETSAGGVEGGLGRRPFEVLKDRVKHVALVSEQEILAATRWMLDQHQYLIEPSAAVAVAACLAGKIPRLEAPAMIILTGRNVSLSTLKKILGQ